MLKNLLDKARDLKNQLDSLRPLSAEVEGRVMQKLRIDWNYHSNNMEGNSLTYGETRALLLYGMTAKGKPLSDHLEISGHEKAIEWLEDMARKKEELSGYFVRRLHEIIFSEQLNTKIKVGSYKEIPNFLISQTGETIQFATPEETPAKMQDLLDRFNKNEAKSDTNPILLAAAFHYEFVRIHPFDDGNGRMSRLLMNFILMRFGYPPAVIKTEEKENYYTALQLSDAQENSLPLAEYLAEAVINSLELMLKGARGERIEEPSDLDKQLAMLEKMLDKPKIEQLRSKDSLKIFMDKNLPVFLNIFFAHTQKFKPFYVENKFCFEYPIFEDINLSNSSSYYWDKESQEPIPYLYRASYDFMDFDILPEIQEVFIKTVLKLHQSYKPQSDDAELKKWTYVFSCEYDTFNRQGYQSFNYQIDIELIFEKKYYSFISKNAELSKYYHEPLTEDELANFFTKEGNAHFAYIQQQIKEQQKSL
jgi:Fic family protein